MIDNVCVVFCLEQYGMKDLLSFILVVSCFEVFLVLVYQQWSSHICQVADSAGTTTWV